MGIYKTVFLQKSRNRSFTYLLSMESRNIKILQALASSTRDQIVKCLREGIEHPDDIAKEIGIIRQGVDKHLLELHALGIVDREAIFPPDGRPKIVYKMSGMGLELYGAIDKLIEDFYLRLKGRYERLKEDLDKRLIEGEISESVYLKQLEKLKSRYIQE